MTENLSGVTAGSPMGGTPITFSQKTNYPMPHLLAAPPIFLALSPFQRFTNVTGSLVSYYAATIRINQHGPSLGRSLWDEPLP